MDRNHSILIVDDQPYIREILSRWLTCEGYGCREADSADEALRLLKDGDFSLLLADITMPGKSGLDLLPVVSAEYPHLAVIMVTAVDDRRTAIRSLELGASAYLMKPFDQDEVIIGVAGALERRRMLMESQVHRRGLEEEVRARTAEIRRREEEIALRLVWAAECRDQTTGAHIRRIGLYSESIARVLGWNGLAVDDIKIAAAMHDIGKIGVPDRVLLKPGKLSPEEFEEVKRHPEIGAGILEGSDVPLLQMAKSIVLCHHEKWDGSGYPNSLAGEDIPEEARIVAIADVYDALTRQRIYKPALPEKESIEIMRQDVGKHFDPRIFGCFMEILSELSQIREQVSDAASQLRL